MTEEKANNLTVGNSLGRYRILRQLGAGGMGEVYLAEDTRLHRKVALKVLPENIAADKERLQRFEQEARAASSLNHPNILTVYEFGFERDIHFLATELIEGETLRETIGGGELSLTDTLNIAEQTAFALSAAHAAGIVHRDLKPENIMIRRDGIVKVLDFGLAKLIENKEVSPDAETDAGSLLRTNPGVVMGTVPYMSPEQATAKEVDAQTDIWSLGVLIYEMVSGKLPFTGETIYEVIVSILKEEPPLLSHYVSGVPNDLEKIVGKSLRKNRDERYQNIKDLQIDLKDLRQDLEFEAKLERSSAPNKNRVNSLDNNREAQTQILETDKPTGATEAAVSTKDAITHPASSAEYVVREIKQHKRGIFAALSIVLLLGVGFGYWFYANRSSLTNTKQINSVAILPFENGSGDASLDYLSDGLSESLIDKLSQLPQLKVIARSSSFKYRGANIDVQDAASKLGVQAIVMGRVIRVGENLTVRVEMIDAGENRQLWSEQYNRKASDLLSIQQEIAQTASEKLRLRLSGAQEQQLEKRETVNPQAYELVLKGKFYDDKGGNEDLKKANEYYQQAVAVDPNYAVAYAKLSINYNNLTFNGIVDPKEYRPKAEAAARKALELDANLADAHFALANLQLDAWNWTVAEAEYKRALELNPNLGDAHWYYSGYLVRIGRYDEAITEVKRARELDPLSLNNNAGVGYILFYARRYDEAIEALQRTLEIDSNYAVPYVSLGYVYAAKGMHQEAITAYQNAIRLGAEGSSMQIFLGAAYAQAGERGKAQEILKQLQTSKEYVSPGELAILYGALGNKEAAFQSLEKAYAEHDLQLQFLKVDPAFDPLRSDARFQDLIRRVGFPP
ncbi:MAG: protein kinase [Acidobacteria bacterium]|nr:protein kinase [Acidobacteriota bacterium]